MSLRRASSVDEYVDWIRAAVAEVEDLRDRLEFGQTDGASLPVFLAPLEAGVKAIERAMRDGSYRFGREDLAFIDLIAEHSAQIPFHSLLEQIDETHRRGLDLEGT
ncbi:general secretion pathway protein GspF [Thiococcus pfennigii]|jgi:hypothetical protein|uniref:general secretion pathway protein GspF n=1 Tax=Thiococcus pfennigii TaxID=1057 RepID=UPI001903BC42|nr:general secretion pathway protein GspF [Thiococcus pfennigii]MBK1699864.1 general secretion pathway protein GspF [Thiococcus pfennigii]MBK1732536.1 general secretion pathway protein GspF [Thiococcus pfennigii]